MSQAGAFAMTAWGAMTCLAACGAPVMPALTSASELGDPIEHVCTSDELFADVPVEALVLGEDLWVRGAGGTLAAVRLPGDNSIRFHLENERVVDMHQSSSGALWALSVADGPGDMRVWQRTTGGWSPLWEMGAPSEAMALVELGGWPAVVTPERLYVATGELWTQELSPALPNVTHYQAAAQGSSIWVTARGVGWLYHLDATTGKTTGVADVRPQPCEGLLDPSCDVITDLDPDPDKPDCALVTTRGRVLRACLDESVSQAPGMRRALRAKWAEQIRALAMLYPQGSASRLHLLSLIRAENPMELVRDNLRIDLPELDADPVDALALSGAGYVALGSEALYSVQGLRTRRSEVPAGRSRCGLEVTETASAVIVNASQPLPLLASRDVPRQQLSAPLTAPPPPCADTVIYFARGQGEGAVSVVLRCEASRVTMVQRAVPQDRFFDVPLASWRALWADLERAQWRGWKSCDPTESVASSNDRFMISTPKHTLQVDCPRTELNNRQRAVLERLRDIFEQTRRADQSPATGDSHPD